MLPITANVFPYVTYFNKLSTGKLLDTIGFA
jgi:hypothetical protein